MLTTVTNRELSSLLREFQQLAVLTVSMARLSRRPLILTACVLICCLLGLSLYGLVIAPSREGAVMSPSLFYSIPQQQRGLSSTALEDLDPNDPVLASFFSSLPPFKRLVPSRPTPQCSHASTAMRIQNLDTTTKPGPFPNILARQDSEASLHLLALVVQAFQEGEICSWLDASSLLGAYHHAAPLPYTSFIEVGILLSDLKKTLSVRVVAKTANFFAKIVNFLSRPCDCTQKRV